MGLGEGEGSWDEITRSTVMATLGGNDLGEAEQDAK